MSRKGPNEKLGSQDNMTETLSLRALHAIFSLGCPPRPWSDQHVFDFLAEYEPHRLFEELLSFPNCGQGTAAEIKNFMAAMSKDVEPHE